MCSGQGACADVAVAVRGTTAEPWRALTLGVGGGQSIVADALSSCRSRRAVPHMKGKQRHEVCVCVCVASLVVAGRLKWGVAHLSTHPLHACHPPLTRISRRLPACGRRVKLAAAAVKTTDVLLQAGPDTSPSDAIRRRRPSIHAPALPGEALWEMWP